MSAAPKGDAAASRRRRRAGWLGAALVAALALVLGDALPPAPVAAEDAAASVDAAEPARPVASPAAPAPRRPLPRQAWPAAPAAALAAWSAPESAPAALPVRPASAPAGASANTPAPAPAFTLIGRYVDERGPAAILATPQRTVVVRAGDMADAQWRVDGVAAQRVELTWLPGAHKRSLAYPNVP